MVVIVGASLAWPPTESVAAARPPTGVHTVAAVPTWIAPSLLFSTGKEVLLFGTNRTRSERATRNEGASYDLSAKRWKQIAAAPFDPPILWPNALWTGRELVVVGVSCDNRGTPEDDEPRCYPGSLVAASYNPKRDGWRSIDVPDSLAAGFTPGNVGAAGQSVGALDGNAVFEISGQLWSLDPRTERWRHRDMGRAYSACIASNRLIAQSASAIAVVDVGAGSVSEVSPVPAVDPPGPFLFVCGRDAVYAYTMVLTSAWRYDLDANVWEELPAPPQPTAFGSPAAWTGRELLIGLTIRSRDPVTTTRDGFVFDPETNAWRTTPDAILAGGPGEQVWSDGYAYQLGYDSSGKAKLETYRPE